MSFNYAEKSTPFVLSPSSLDEHLARGWYRMGSSIFTTHFLFFNKRPFSAVWIRLDLNTFRFSKRQRKLLRRNAVLFEVAHGPRQIDAEREELYTVYAEDFDGRLSPSIADSLEDYGEFTVFDTQEVTVREKLTGKLVANSYYDVGEDSAASILGIYQPVMKSFSLGYYTMLLEIEDCLRRGFRYYYPGYVVPGYQRFDYKLRLGVSEYYDLHAGDWKPFAEAEIEQQGPTEIQKLKLGEVLDRFAAQDITRHLIIYPLFEAELYDAWNDSYFPYPYLIYLGNTVDKEPIVLSFDPKSRCYVITHCTHLVQTQSIYNASYLSQFSGSEFYVQLLTARSILYRSTSVEDLMTVILRGLRKT
ncbi:arginine-tRNA-protein transferase [Neolewinella antarctica]|uniref:Arginine-tRNA-protein transferase n=1 Tax=Neolewinella antarctica TaxID=442734 RepID=A0ABX0X6I4_9BACT|nr:arginine-tRNA-protein transferase [Neolewinella antarctica]NJC24628.1 arginine-tRNA-protein transferase [Neolewinella antarctica]